MKKLAQELDKIAVFVTVAEKGKINEASELLHLTQPSVSRSIQKLEEAFGVEVFTRSRDGVRLTQAGSLLYEAASRMLRELDDIQIRAQSINHDFAGNLTVGTYESLAEYLWPDFLMDFQSKHPALHLSVKTNFYQDPLADLVSGRVDLLVDAEPQVKTSLISWPLYSDKFSFFVSPAFGNKRISPSEATAENIIFVQKAFDENRLTIDDHLQQAGYRFARQYCFDSFSTVKRLCIKGMGIAVLPKRLAEYDVKQKLIKPISLKGFSTDGFGRHSICATVVSENGKDLRLKKLIALLKSHLDQFRTAELWKG